LRRFRREAEVAEPVGPDAGHTKSLQLGTRLSGPLTLADGDNPGPQRYLPGDGLPDAGQGTSVAAPAPSDGVVFVGQVTVVRGGQGHLRAREQLPPRVLDMSQVAVHLSCQPRIDGMAE
jgi:hypothetical protein